MTCGPRFLRVLAGVSFVGALSVGVLVACLPPSLPAAVDLFVFPPLLLVNAGVMLNIAWASGDGGDDDGDGRGRGGPDHPNGGAELDWERFEADFRAYAIRRKREPVGALPRTHRNTLS